MCAFVYGCLPSIDTFTQFINAVTGWETTLEELLKTGERIANLRHAFNLREGLNPLNFEVPGRVYGIPPKTEGPTAGITIDQDTLFNEYLAAMDWDLKTTKPSKKKLEELNLLDVAQELWR
jgi:aldehyde:ferredoxin oxidoreductase